MKHLMYSAAFGLMVLTAACASSNQTGQTMNNDINNAANGVSNMFTPDNAQKTSEETNKAASNVSNSIDSTVTGKPKR